jgi:uncharacterized protein (TIGR02145 family)
MNSYLLFSSVPIATFLFHFLRLTLLFGLGLFLGSSSVNAQNLPTLPVRPKTVQKSKTTIPPGKTNEKPLVLTQTIKFLSDAPGALFIDGLRIGSVEPDIPYKTELKKGEYLIKVKGLNDESDQLSQTILVEETGSDRIVRLYLQPVINARIEKEKIIKLEAERQKEILRQKELARQKEEELLKARRDRYFEETRATISTKVDGKYWNTKNLNVSYFRNGDSIPEARTAEEWVQYGKEGKPAWCYYNNDPVFYSLEASRQPLSGMVPGKMYNAFAVLDPRGIAPKGWHVATVEEWESLIKNTYNVSALNNGVITSWAAYFLKSKQGWYKQVSQGKTLIDQNGPNKWGFLALPAVCRYGDDGKYFTLNSDFNTNWWAMNGPSGTSVQMIRMYQKTEINNAVLTQHTASRERAYTNGFYVRCVQD